MWEALGVHEHDELGGAHHALLAETNTQASLDLQLHGERVDGGKGGALDENDEEIRRRKRRRGEDGECNDAVRQFGSISCSG